MTAATYYADGEWNYTCDLCGATGVKSSNSMKTWNGLRVCKHHKEVRNPQDFLRGVKDDQSVPWSRPEPVEVFPFENWLLQENGSVLMQEDGWFLTVDAISPNLVF